MITVPKQEGSFKDLLEKITATGPQCGQRYLPDEIGKLAGQEFSHQGLALVLLIAARDSLRRTYGEEKSLGSLEGMALVNSILSRYVRALVPTEAAAEEVLSEIREQLIAVV